MLVDINKIKVHDRIRKEFGNIDELAEDIKENGLINPPVVTPDLQLIAGERRLRACQKLGWKQIEVRVMTVRDAEHQLKLEVNENENRKDFTFSEKMEWARRLERLERVKAEERMKAGKKINPDANLNEGRTAKIVAKESGFGSEGTYRKAKFIHEHADKETIRKLDSEEISIHKAYTELKAEVDKEKKARKEAEAKIKDLEQKLERAKTMEPEVKIVEREIVKEVVPDSIKQKLKEDEKKVLLYRNRLKELEEKIQAYELRNTTDFDEQKAEAQRRKLQLEADIDVLQLRVHVNEFLEKVSITAYMEGALATANPVTKQKMHESLDMLDAFFRQVRTHLKAKNIGGVING